jgi:hypothetical protein
VMARMVRLAGMNGRIDVSNSCDGTRKRPGIDSGLSPFRSRMGLIVHAARALDNPQTSRNQFCTVFTLAWGLTSR